MMKRVCAFILCITFMLVLCIPASAADDEYSFETALESGKTEVAVGDTFTVDFVVSGITDESGLVAVDADIIYDGTVLEYIGSKVFFPDEWTGDNENLTTAATEDGVSKVLVSYSNDGRTGKGYTGSSIKTEITFRAISGQGKESELRVYSYDGAFGLNDRNQTVYGRGCVTNILIGSDQTLKTIIAVCAVAVVVVTAVFCIITGKKRDREKKG